MDSPSLYEPADELIWSNTAHGDRRLTWKELAAVQEDELRRLRGLAGLVQDLDRCPHGRHVRDVCFSCEEQSESRNVGNLFIRPMDRRVGTRLSGDPIYLRDLLEAANG